MYDIQTQAKMEAAAKMASGAGQNAIKGSDRPTNEIVRGLQEIAERISHLNQQVDVLYDRLQPVRIPMLSCDSNQATAESEASPFGQQLRITNYRLDLLQNSLGRLLGEIVL